MVWVLWDILIPLLASFALGTLLGWLLWSWRRQRHESAEYAVESADVSSSDATIVETLTGESVADEPMKSALPETEVEVTQPEAVDHSENIEAGTSKKSAVTSETNSVARVTEAANIVLINERDRANEALENLQCETDAMRERIAELEAATQHSTDTMPVNDDTDTKDNEEPDHLRNELQQLDNTLEKERAARRATELELLNIKNKHDKLAKEIASIVGAAENTNALYESEEKVNLLQQQPDETECRVENTADIEDENIQADKFEQSNTTTVSEAVTADQSTIETTLETGIDSSDPDDLVESGVLQAEDLTKQQVTAKNCVVTKELTSSREKPPSKKRDKLTDIRGVGPVLEKMLNENGIYYFDQVANLDESGMEQLQLQIPQCAGRIKRDGWVKQAQKLQLKKYGEIA